MSPIASVRGLADYHDARARVYHQIARLLCGARRYERPIIRTQLELASRVLGDPPALGQLMREIDALRARISTASLRRLGATPCSLPDELSRLNLFAGAELRALPEANCEAEALAIVSERVAGALLSGDLARGLELALLQQKFLDEHGGRCLLALARALAEHEHALLRTTGAALDWLVRRDLEMGAA